MPEKLSCFWCLFEMISNPEYAREFGPTGKKVATLWGGTPVCSSHAFQIGRHQTIGYDIKVAASEKEFGVRGQKGAVHA